VRWKRWIGYFEFSNFIFCFNLKNSTPSIFLSIMVKAQIWISVLKNKSSAALLFFQSLCFIIFQNFLSATAILLNCFSSSEHPNQVREKSTYLISSDSHARITIFHLKIKIYFLCIHLSYKLCFTCLKLMSVYVI
jgi:hypothetical protein